MSNFPGTWTTLYSGVDWCSAYVSSPNVPYPQPPGRYPSINLLRIDLGDAKITTYSSSKADLSPDGVVLSAFLTRTFEASNDIATQGVVGINANFFNNTAGNKNQLHGLAVSNGTSVSPAASGSLRSRSARTVPPGSAAMPGATRGRRSPVLAG